MAVQKRFRVVIRQRINFLPGADLGVPESIKPQETEGYSQERDITDYVENYKITRTRGILAQDVTLDIINPQGILTPTNSDSAFNRTLRSGIDTYTPILVEGNEVSIYRVPQGANILDSGTWKPRFRGKIRKVGHGTVEGFDSLQITAGSVLSEAVKRTASGTYSPIMYSSSVIPANSFFALPKLVTAVAQFRDVTPTQMLLKFPVSIYGEPSTPEPGEIPSELLAKNIWWDRNDVFYRSGRYLAKPYFIKSAFTYTDSNGNSQVITPNWADEPGETAKTPVPVTANTATAIWTLEGHSWFVESGTVTKDTAEIFDDPTSSMKLVEASMRHETTRLPVNCKSRIVMGYRMTDASSIHITIQKRVYNRTAYTYGTPTTVADYTINGPSTFDAAQLGGLVLNPPTGSFYQWKRVILDVPELASSTFSSDTDASLTVFTTRISVSGQAWVDSPRWEYLSVDKNEKGQAVFVETNVMDLPSGERWTTEDGIIFRSPYPQHRVMSKKNQRVILRSWGVPYAAGTCSGFGPNNLIHRCLPEGTLFERELTEGSEYEVLNDKGAIQLSATFRRCEIFVAGTHYDLANSQHMEASSMLTRLLMEGGIPASKISLESSGIILSRVSLGVDTSTSILKAVKDILGQLPSNYYLYEDGDANVFGKYIQQNGSPRIYNPVVQIPMPQNSGGVLVPDAEYWYGVTALMADGKETLLSNLASTVAYQDYYDFQHASIVTKGSIPALKIKPVPHMVGLVVRRAKAYKTAKDTIVKAAPQPAYYFSFENPAALRSSDAVVDAANGRGTTTFVDATGAFSAFSIVEGS